MLNELSANFLERAALIIERRRRAGTPAEQDLLAAEIAAWRLHIKKLRRGLPKDDPQLRLAMANLPSTESSAGAHRK